MRGVESDLYLAMDDRGRLYGEGDRLNSNVLFTEHAQVRQTVYFVQWISVIVTNITGNQISILC